MSSHAPLAVQPRNVATLRDADTRFDGARTVELVQDAKVVSRSPGRLDLVGATQDLILSIVIEAVIDGVVRVKIAREVEDVTASAAAVTLVPGAGVFGSVREGADGLTVDAGSLRAEVQLHPFHVRFTDSEGRLVLEQQSDDRHATGESRGTPLGMTRAGEASAFHDWFRIRADEHFYGLGESSTGLDKRGQHALIWTSDAYGVGSPRMYKPVPFVISTAGYGLLVDSGAPVEFDIGRASSSSLSVIAPDSALDYYVIGGTPRTITERYHELTGLTRLPPRWSFGLWMSTGFLPQTQESVEAWLDKLVSRDFPCDVVHIDPYWMKHGRWCDLQWDRGAFPEPQRMLRRIHDAGLRACLWINPYVSVASPVFTEGDNRGFFLRAQDGTSWRGAVWGDDVVHPDVAIVDFTNREACVWFEGLLTAVLADGVDIFKTDFGEGVPAEVIASNGLTGSELHNVYPLLYNEIVAQATERINGHRLIWGRSSYIGGQRYPAQWGGDTSATWEGMASSLRAGLSYSMSGYTFWSHDVGGFSGRPSEELFARWAQWGVLSPMTRLHGTTSRIPWEWDDDTYDRIRFAATERYRLLPYILWQAYDSVRTSTPMLRPVVFDEPSNPGSWAADFCYLFGRDLLVAPIRGEDGAQLIRVPAGVWIDPLTRSAVHGDQFVQRTVVDSSALPFLVRSGAIIPTVDGLTRVPEGPLSGIALEVWGPTDRTADIDDGESSYSVQTSLSNGTLTVTVTGEVDLSCVRVIDLDGATAAVSVNGRVWHTHRVNGDLVATPPQVP